MSHPYENVDLSFGKLKELFDHAVRGKLETLTVKTDGQSLYLSYNPRTKQALAALNENDIEGIWIDAQTLEKSRKKPGLTRPELIKRWEQKEFKPKTEKNPEGKGIDKETLALLTDAFVGALDDWEGAIALMPGNVKLDLFGPSGTYYYACEVMNPGTIDPETGETKGGTKNVINYDTKTLLVHRVKQMELVRDERGEKQVVTNEGGDHKKVATLQAYLDANEEIEKDSNAYKVTVNKIHQLDELDDHTMALEAKAAVDELMSNPNYNLTDSDTIGDYMIKSIAWEVYNNLPNVGEELKDIIVKKILGQKGVETMPQIQKRYVDELPEGDPGTDWSMIQEMIDNRGEIWKKVRWPLEEITHNFATQFLEAWNTLFSFIKDQGYGIQRLQDDLRNQISAIRAAGKSGNLDQKVIDKMEDIFKSKIGRKNSKGEMIGDETVVKVPEEGIVFDYDGHQYKFTGHFAPINQIMGMLRYNRGGTPPIKEHVEDFGHEDIDQDIILTDDEEEIELTDTDGNGRKDIYIYPGRFQPMGKHHADTYKTIANKYGSENVYVATSGKVEYPKSPFTFDEKVEIMIRHGIPIDKIVEVENPYSILKGDPLGLLDKYNPGEMEATYFIGAKDMDEDPRFKKLSGITKRDPSGYHWKLEVAPHISRDVEGFGEMSGTSLRNALERSDEETFEKIMGDGFKDAPEIHQMVLNKLNRTKEDYEEELEEISAMGMGAVQGSGGKKDDKKNPSLIRQEGMIMREEMVAELKFRELIRKRISQKMEENKKEGIIYINENQRQMIEKYRVENALRKCIRRIILQEKTEPVPHSNTGINQLGDLLKKIVPILSRGFKGLTTSDDQKDSYRSHIINAMINALAIDRAEDEIGVEALAEATESEDLEITLDDPDEEKFIDIEDTGGEEEEEEEAFETLRGYDLTGRNIAMKDFDRIERITLDSYAVLDDEKDQDLFYDYLLTNLKLYFDQFEEESEPLPEEPSTDTYKTEKENVPTPGAEQTLQEDAVSKAKSERDREDSRHTGKQKNTYNKAVRRKGKSNAQNAKLKWTNPDALDGEENLDEKAPPGMKKDVEALKRDHSDEDSFKIAWGNYNKKNEK